MDLRLQNLLAAYPIEKLMKTIPTGLFIVTPELEIVYWNDEAERITGFAPEDAVGQHCSFLAGVPCGDGCGLFDPEIPKPQTGISCSIITKQGGRINLSKNIDLLYDAEGQVIGGIESFVDITRLKKLQTNLKEEVSQRTRALENEQSKLNAVLDGMTDLAYICSDDFKICFMNRAMLELYGETQGQKCYEAMHDQTEVCSDCPMGRVQKGEIVKQERKLSITGRSYEIIHSPMQSAAGKILKLGVCRDITERLQNETRLKEANADLDAFVATVSHDLRSPLTPLIGFAEFLLDQYGPDLDETAVSCLSEIEGTGRRMQALLEDLLTLARVGQVARPSKPVELKRVLKEVRQELAVQILRKKARLEIGLLPAVRIAETLLVDLFRNLVRNALTYAVDINPLIEVRGVKMLGRVEIQVIDHGPGVPGEERELIFEPFQRGEIAKNVPGSGVGLATVRKIVRLYKGQVSVAETPGGGATFIVEFFED